MCIIVDACVAHHLFSRTPTELGRLVRDWVLKGENRLVYGAKHQAELFHTTEARRWMLQAVRAGKARLVSANAISAELAALDAIAQEITCNDRHILALARVSGAKVLFTDDHDLMRDFRNPRIIQPRGWIFSRPVHRKKLHASKTCCGR